MEESEIHQTSHAQFVIGFCIEFHSGRSTNSCKTKPTSKVINYAQLCDKVYKPIMACVVTEEYQCMSVRI
jgi:hypothetical protein